MNEQTAAHYIDTLGLQPHPEGGWYRETWRAEAPGGERATATAILFLLEAHQRSHWHRVDAAEMWLWQAGCPLRLLIAPDAASTATECVLGQDARSGQQLQGLVPAGHWQATEPLDGWGHASCIVSPGFEFSGFELAPPGWSPGR